MIAPPTCAKCAIPPPKIENPVTPENRSNAIKTGIKYFAAIGTGKNIKANFAFGNVIPKATKTPYIAPDAQTAGVL